MNRLKKKLNSEEFFSEIQQTTVLEDIEVPVDIGWRIDDHEKVFNNCQFKDWVFENRANTLQFNDCTFNTLQITLTKTTKKVILNNCSAKNVELIGRQDTSMYRIELTGDATNIEKFEINGEFFCNKIILDGITGLRKTTMQLNCSNIDVHNARGIEYLVVFGEVKKQIDFKNCRDMSFIVIRDMKTERIEISDSGNLNVNLESIDVKYINFNRCTSTSIETTYLAADHLGLNDGSYETIRFYHDCNFNFSASPITEKLTINHLTFRAAKPQKDRILKIEKAKIKELLFEGLQNDALILFLNCEVSNVLRFYQSNLGKFQFTNVKVEESCRIDLLDSSIIDVHFNSFRWNRSYKLFEDFDAEILVRHDSQINFLHSLRESYRQLKANYLKNGNKIEALEFQRREMEIHFKILRQKRFHNWHNLGNYLIVATNKWFSDFGQNIWKPVVFLLLSHLIFSNLIFHNFQLGFNPTYVLTELDYSNTFRAINLYFQTLLPIHGTSAKDMFGREISIGGLWDFLDRILSSYFIFYFVSATRKYHQ
jgi:hypothetical protein